MSIDPLITSFFHFNPFLGEERLYHWADLALLVAEFNCVASLELNLILLIMLDFLFGFKGEIIKSLLKTFIRLKIKKKLLFDN